MLPSRFSNSNFLWCKNCLKLKHIIRDGFKVNYLKQNISFFVRNFHFTASLSAKSFQDRENEHAHTILENIPSLAKSVRRHPAEGGSFPTISRNSSPSLKDFFQNTESNSSAIHMIFVYGTLKRGEPNHYLLLEGDGNAKFAGDGETVERYPLVIASRYNIPFLLHVENAGHRVVGELYEVDGVKLRIMDELENHPSNYTRLMVPIMMLNGQSESHVQAWTYFLRNFRPELLSLSYLQKYSSSGDHGLPYVAGYDRDSSNPDEEEYITDVQIEETSEPEDMYK